MANSILNPPGSLPSPERVEEIARRVLEIDTPDQPTPEWFMPILTKFLTNNPGDDHFIIELPDPSAPARGGTGYGAITCMEDECWTNINLSPDPEQLDGGKANGVGTLWDYADHCRGEDHIKCRNQRLKRMGFVAPESALLSSPFTSSQAGPSRLASSQIQPSSSGSAHIIRDHPPNHPSMGASSSNYRDALFVDSDSDDGIEFVGRSSPRKNVVLVEDSDDDQNPSIGSSQSQSSRLKSLQPTGSSGGNSRPWIRVWSSMSLSDRRHAINQELRDLGKLPGISSFDANRVIARRKDALRSIEGSGCLMQWTPPDPLIFQAFPNLYVHPRLAETFECPKPAVCALINPAARVTASAVAGPSTSLRSPFSYAMDAISHTERATGAFLVAVNAAWQRLDMQSRRAQLINEQNALRQAISRFEAIPQLQGIKRVLCDRLMSHLKLIASDNPTWLPPSSELLKLVPELRHVVHQSLMAFLPRLRDEDDDVDPHGLSEEWNRPTGPALTDYFKDALLDFQDDATVEEASKTLGLSTTSGLLPGADFTLMPHQIMGVAFMMKREQRKGKGGRGGLLCDAMGLGKTIQTLALMLARDERPADYERAPQLIVAPLALLVQWKEEIETKTTKGFRVYIHHGANRLKSAAQIRNSYDIVLTTYGTLCSESGITKQKQKMKVGEGSDDDSDYIEKKKRGPLFKIHWFRAILDEAHNVRNRRTISARSVLQLDVLHPWILTGTPIVNSLGDVGPALEFIGAMGLSQYHHEVVKREKKQPKNASRRCQAILKPLMLRRNKDTELNGKKILELPVKTVNLAWQDFELDERAIYAAIEQRARMRVSKFLKAGTVMKNYHVVLVLLTRLRQAANHPWLLRRTPGDEGRDGDLLVDDEAFGADLGQCRNNDEDEYGRAVAILGKAAVDALAKKLEERHERLSNEDVQDDKELECCICMEPLDGSEVITPCSHLYCRVCISNYFIQPIRDTTGLTDEDVDAGCRSCPMCRSRLKPGQVFRCAAIFRPTVATPEVDDDDDDDADIKPDVKPNIAADRKGKKRARSAAESFFGSLNQDQGEPEEDEKPERKRTRGNRKGKSRATSVDATSVDDDDDVEEIEAQVPPSTKLRRTLELVQGFLEEDPNTKVLIFSQFVAFLDLLSDFLKDNGIPSLGYRGSMSASARDEAVRRFRTAPGIVDPIPVMLISTKAGGVGLNLTMAHKVIMCDLAWNPATENQAIDRSHRIGQRKPVQVERLVIRDTVEDRLLAIQEHKGLLADGAMGEGSIGRLGRLTLDDIRKLFAINARDEE